MKKIIFWVLIITLLSVTFVACENATSLSFSQESYSIKPNVTFTPKINILPKSAEYTLTVANTTIATVNGNEITTLKEGMTTITATSGNKEVTATLIVSNSSEETVDQTITADTYYVNFYLANYTLIGLDSQLLHTQPCVANSLVFRTLPVYEGYYVHGWYTDVSCTNKFDSNTTRITKNMNLYCYAEQLENGFLYTDDMLIKGLIYPSLPHENLVLPAEDDGVEIKGIAEGAFKNDTQLITVTIPSTYTTIGKMAFAGCVNLTTVTIENNSQLKSIGAYAFCLTVTANEDGEYETDDNACTKLSSINLPDCVETIDNFAFAYCSSLILNGIPSSLSTINYGAFLGTKINNLNLINVETIYEYAFYDCSTLTDVINTHNVTYCGTDAFYKTGLYNQQSYSEIKYVDTLVVGGNALVGDGKLYLNDDTTLIAPDSFNGDKFTDVTVYFPTNTTVSIDKDSFLTQQNGVCLVVPEDKLSLYKENNPYYENNFCTKYVIEVNDENAVNFGKHTLLKFSGTKYYYDLFERKLTSNQLYKSPSEIRFSQLQYGNYITRINTHAIDFGENGGNLTLLETASVTEIAHMAISDCAKLKAIYFTNASSIVTLNSSNSLQFSTFADDCYIYVKSSDLHLYKDAYYGVRTTAYNRLKSDE